MIERDNLSRNVFGAGAFVLAGIIIAGVLSPWVPNAKEAIANVVLGNVLGWPAMVLGYYFGSSTGSKAKDAALAAAIPSPSAPLDLAGAELPPERT